MVHLIHGFLARRLFQITMQNSHLVALALQVADQGIRPSLGGREDDGLGHVLRLHIMSQQMMLVSGIIGPVNALADLLMLLDVTGQLNGLRILEEGLGHSQHLPFQRRGKQQGLSLFGDRSPQFFVYRQ